MATFGVVFPFFELRNRVDARAKQPDLLTRYNEPLGQPGFLILIRMTPPTVMNGLSDVDLVDIANARSLIHASGPIQTRAEALALRDRSHPVKRHVGEEAERGFHSNDELSHDPSPDTWPSAARTRASK